MPQATLTKSSFLRNHKGLVITTIVLVSIFLLSTAGLAYAGFVPGVTPLMRVNKPIDLGIKYSDQDYQQFQAKTLSTVSNFNEGGQNGDPGAQLVILGANSIKAKLTQEELSAFVNKLPWTVSPISNSQFRLSEGVAEFSGNIKSAYVSDLIQTLYPNTDYNQLNPVLKLAGRLYNPAVYARFSISATNTTGGPGHGQLHLKVLALKVNQIDLSDNVANLKELNVTIPEGSHDQGIPYSISSLAVSNGAADVYGTVPSEYSVGGGDPTVLCSNHHGTSLVSLNAIDGHLGSTIKYCE